MQALKKKIYGYTHTLEIHRHTLRKECFIIYQHYWILPSPWSRRKQKRERERRKQGKEKEREGEERRIQGKEKSKERLVTIIRMDMRSQSTYLYYF